MIFFAFGVSGAIVRRMTIGESRKERVVGKGMARFFMLAPSPPPEHRISRCSFAFLRGGRLQISIFPPPRPVFVPRHLVGMYRFDVGEEICVLFFSWKALSCGVGWVARTHLRLQLWFSNLFYQATRKAPVVWPRAWFFRGGRGPRGVF